MFCLSENGRNLEKKWSEGVFTISNPLKLKLTSALYFSFPSSSFFWMWSANDTIERRQTEGNNDSMHYTMLFNL